MAAPAPLPALVLAGYDPAPLHTRPSAAPATLPGNTNLPGNTALTGHKALLELNGRPLVAYTLDALRGSPRVGAITVVGFERAQCDLGGGLSYLPNQPSLVENGLHGLRTIAAEIPEGTHVLVTGSDAPLLSAEAITWFVDACTPWSADLYLGVASQATIEARFPASKRTYLRLREGRFCSADLFLVRPAAVLNQEPLLRDLLARRKHPLDQVRRVGLGWILRLLAGRAGLGDADPAARRLAALSARAVPLPFAGAAMDVDKPFQLEIVRRALADDTPAP
jgi:hypothetical protein